MTKVRRWPFATLVAAVALLLIALPRSRARSVEELFVARAQAAAAAGEICTMPPLPGEEQERQLAIPTARDLGGDMPPVRMVVDPYPSFNGVVVDSIHDLVMMSDTNRKSLLL